MEKKKKIIIFLKTPVFQNFQIRKKIRMNQINIEFPSHKDLAQRIIIRGKFVLIKVTTKISKLIQLTT